MSKRIPYIKNYPLKPLRIDDNGYVIFTTNGTDEVFANEEQCKAYGYKYDNATRTCRAFSVTPNLYNQIRNETNTIKGVRNTIGIGTENTMVRGNNNMTNGQSRNLFINGDDNYIYNQVDNCVVTGRYSETYTKNSISLGGNSDGALLGERQVQWFMFGTTTTAGGTHASYLNNDGVTSRIQLPLNTGVFIHVDALALRVGGTSTGSVGDIASWNCRGVAVSKTTGEGSTFSRQRQTLSSQGTTSSWRPTINVNTDGQLTVNVRGAANTTVEWALTVRLTQIKTSVTL